jgi:hypothetical protein
MTNEDFQLMSLLEKAMNEVFGRTDTQITDYEEVHKAFAKMKPYRLIIFLETKRKLDALSTFISGSYDYRELYEVYEKLKSGMFDDLSDIEVGSNREELCICQQFEDTITTPGELLEAIS